MTRRRHDMPFGAAVLDDGRVRFRLWAPAAERIDLCLVEGSDRDVTEYGPIPMTAEGDGWFGLVTDLAAAGSRYRFRIDGAREVPDPASRYQPADVHGPSEVIDPGVFAWHDGDWTGRPWEEAVLYELHVGTFTPKGSFAGVMDRIDHLASLGVTAIELMPVADFPGGHSWGYDGALLFAPDCRYGTPDELKTLIQAAHARGLMVFLDVVYNHFGPEGNYLHLYAPQFFTEDRHTPWGAAINVDGEDAHWVREFFIHNALYWLEEYHFDGLRLDAVHAIEDDSTPDLLTALAERVNRAFAGRRQVHLVLENDHNAARYLMRDRAHSPRWYVAQWNDDIHHALHAVLTGETAGCYADYGDDPLSHLGRCLAEGFAYQGERSIYRNDEPRGEPSGHLPATAFVSFLQNHDQSGNRAFGERIGALTSDERQRAALALLLLAPAPPLLFMGQEWGCRQPFLFFGDLGPDLAGSVTAGRRREFARLPEFADPAARDRIPDPMDPQTFLDCVLDWADADRPEQRSWLDLHRDLLAVRHRELVPRLRGGVCTGAPCQRLGATGLRAEWRLADGSLLVLETNLGDQAIPLEPRAEAPVLFATHPVPRRGTARDELAPWSVCWSLRPGIDTA